MFWKTKVVIQQKTVEVPVEVPGPERIKTIKEPLNVALMKAHTELLAEHRLLLNNHTILIDTLRQTPHWANPSPTPLYRTEEEEDALVHAPDGRRLSVVPAVPNPFADTREDERLLATLGLDPNIDYN